LYPCFLSNHVNTCAILDVDECNQNVCHQRCTNTVGSFLCSCHAGYRMLADRTCAGMISSILLAFYSRCISMNITCNTRSHLDVCDSYLRSRHAYVLECALGLWGMGCANKCECSDEGTITCDKVRACVCKPGYMGNSCEVDIDECDQDPNICGDTQQCVNTAGSYFCKCRHGFVWNDNECIGTYTSLVIIIRDKVCIHMQIF